MNDATIKLLGDIVAPYSGEPDLRARFNMAMAIAVEDPDPPAPVGAALDGFLEEESEDRLRILQHAVARLGLWGIGPERFIALVAHLKLEAHLAARDAANALALVPYTERTHLSPAALHAVEVAEMVLHDAQDGIMQIDDDEIFHDALRGVRECWTSGDRVGL